MEARCRVEVEGVDGAVGADVPAFGDSRPDLQVGIEHDQPAEQIPDRAGGTDVGDGRIEFLGFPGVERKRCCPVEGKRIGGLHAQAARRGQENLEVASPAYLARRAPDSGRPPAWPASPLPRCSNPPPAAAQIAGLTALEGELGCLVDDDFGAVQRPDGQQVDVGSARSEVRRLGREPDRVHRSAHP